MSIYNKDFVFLNIEASTAEDVITYMAQKLHEKGIVKKEYLTRIIQREADFPTGLNCGAVNVAVPHSECELVNSPCLGIGVLKNPVGFHQMDDTEKVIPVSVVFMFALTEPHAHVEMLQKVFEFIQKPDELKALSEVKNVEEATKILDCNF